MDYLSDDSEEITPIKNVKKLVIIAGSTLSHVVKKRVKKNHMLPVKQGKSYFLSPEEAYVWRLVQEACNCPDTVTPQSSNVNRYVLKKRFNAPLGIHGKLNCITFLMFDCDLRHQR